MLKLSEIIKVKTSKKLHEGIIGDTSNMIGRVQAKGGDVKLLKGSGILELAATLEMSKTKYSSKTMNLFKLLVGSIGEDEVKSIKK
jgi:hypothetical protein